MALSFNLNLSSQNTPSHNGSSETAASLASSNSETAGSLAYVSGSSGGLLSSSSQVDEFVSSNPFSPEIDYSGYESAGSLGCSGESAGSLASGESAGSLACSGESAGSLASAGGCESAGSVSSGGDSFSSFC